MILIVEDELFTRHFHQRLGPLRPFFAGSVEEALVHLRSGQTIDALFTDIYLQKAVFGGCELADEAMVLRPDLRVLYTTGNTTTAQLKSDRSPQKHRSP